jgi:hypothetical protein
MTGDVLQAPLSGANNVTVRGKLLTGTNISVGVRVSVGVGVSVIRGGVGVAIVGAGVGVHDRVAVIAITTGGCVAAARVIAVGAGLGVSGVGLGASCSWPRRRPPLRAKTNPVTTIVIETTAAANQPIRLKAGPVPPDEPARSSEEAKFLGMFPQETLGRKRMA